MDDATNGRRVTWAAVMARRDDSVVRMEISGEIDLYNAKTVEREIADAIGNDSTEVRIDLGDVGYIDSAGMRILFAVAERLRSLQIALTIVAPPGSAARRLADICALGSVTNLEP
jgi:anti-anti-sigma factor